MFSLFPGATGITVKPEILFGETRPFAKTERNAYPADPKKPPARAYSRRERHFSGRRGRGKADFRPGLPDIEIAYFIQFLLHNILNRNRAETGIIAFDNGVFQQFSAGRHQPDVILKHPCRFLHHHGQAQGSQALVLRELVVILDLFQNNAAAQVSGIAQGIRRLSRPCSRNSVFSRESRQNTTIFLAMSPLGNACATARG